MTTPRFGITELADNQAGAAAVVNAAIRKLEALNGADVISRSNTAPPGSPLNGDLHIPAATATGAWTGKEDTFQLYANGWVTIPIKNGVCVYIADEAAGFQRQGGTFVLIGGSGASVPTGTGLRHVVAGVESAAASLVVNADVHASAAIALSKLETISANRLVGSIAGGAPSQITLDTDATMASNSDSRVATQKAVKSYVDAVAQGLSPKTSVRVATTANGNLATAFENGDTIDGVTLATHDRVLVKDQSSAAENGIYVVNASGAPTRALDFDSNAEVQAGAFVFVEEGTVNADSGWVLTTDGTITIGSTSLAFTQFSGAGQITAGAALTKSGNTLDVAVDGSTIEVNADALRLKDAGTTYAKIQNVGACSLPGRSANSSGVLADIAAGANGQVLRRKSNVVGFGAVDLSDGTNAVENVLGVANGGTGQTTEAVPEFEDFYSTSTLAAGSTLRGILNSTDNSLGIEVPAGKTLKVLAIRGHAKAGATAGTYTIDLGFWDGTTFTSCASATGTAAASIYPKAVGTRASPVATLAGSKTVIMAIRNNATSPGALDATWKHRVKMTYIIE